MQEPGQKLLLGFDILCDCAEHDFGRPSGLMLSETCSCDRPTRFLNFGGAVVQQDC